MWDWINRFFKKEPGEENIPVTIPKGEELGERPSFKKIVEQTKQWIEESKDKKYFIDSKREDLCQFHAFFGMKIRNHFKLWAYPWEPEIVDKVDCSPMHPDAISGEAIVRAWEHFKGEELLKALK